MLLNTAMSVLVVDDYAGMLRILRAQLAQIGVNDVDDASDGAKALERLAARRYDLVISDWNMQPMSGIELLQRLRSSADTADLPFIMATAESKTERMVTARRAGADGYIVKPFNAAQLRASIEMACR